MRSTYKSMGSTAKNGKISLKTQQRLLGGDGTFKKQVDITLKIKFFPLYFKLIFIFIFSI